jgi:hypothetical protein
MLLDDEARILGRADFRLPAWLRRLADGRPDEIAAVRVEPFLDEEVDTAEVNIAKVDVLMRARREVPAFDRLSGLSSGALI